MSIISINTSSGITAGSFVDFMNKDFPAMWRQGYDLIGVEYDSGNWYAGFVKDSSITSSFVVGSNYDDLIARNQHNFKKGFKLVDVEQGFDAEYGEFLLGVVHKDIDPLAQITPVTNALIGYDINVQNRENFNYYLASHF